MKCFLLLVVLPCFAAGRCLHFLRNKRELKIIWRRPGHVRYWNTITGEFDKLEALLSNNSAFCSVDEVQDMRGKTLVVAVDPIYPYMMENANSTGLTGIIGDIWTALEETLKFKTVYRITRRNEGYFKTLMNGETHALLVAIAMYMYTSSHYDYSVSFKNNAYALFVISEGERVRRSWYINIFSPGLWLTIFIFTIVIACSSMGMYRIKKFISNNYKEFNDEFSSPSFNLLYVLGGISGQGFQNMPKSLYLRLITLFCLLMGLMLSCGFSSTLTSELANRGSTVALTDLEDVAIKRTHSLCVRNDSSAYIQFTVDETMEGELKDQWKGLVNKNCPDMNNATMLASKLCHPGFVYLEAPDIFLPIYHKVKHKCNIVQMPKTYSSQRLAFLHSRSSPYRRLINTYLMRMYSAGIFTYLEKKWISMETQSKPNQPPWNTFHPVEYEHIHIAFFGLAMMMIVSGFICILENIWYKMQRKFQKINPDSILLGTRDNSLSVTKACYKANSRSIVVRRHRRLSPLLLTKKNIKDSELFRNITIRVNRW